MNTSYFSSKAWHGKNAVAISRGVPKWFKGRAYMALAPSWELVRIKDKDVYTKRYTAEVLNKLEPHKVVKELGDDAVLLCWERSGEFCHRRLVAEWLRATLGIEVSELGQNTKQPKPACKSTPIQGSLFGK